MRPSRNATSTAPSLTSAVPLSNNVAPAFSLQTRLPARTGFAVCLVLVGIAAAPALASRPRPHVICIVADDLRGDVLSAYGGPVPTPNLDRLATRGCRFDRIVCGYPICHVSRTETLTGRVMVAEAAEGKAIPFQPEWSLWPEVMRQSGWDTVHTGKWHVRGKPTELGYERTEALFSSGGAAGASLTFPRSATGRPVTGYRGWTFKTDDGDAIIEWGVGLTPETDRRIADGAVRSVESFPVEGDRSLFLHVNFTAPHDPLLWPEQMERRYRPESVTLPVNFRPEHPFDHGNAGGRDETIVPPPRTREEVRRQRAVYFALVEQIDVQVGRILDALQARGMLENSLVIFTSDQGMAIGSHGLMGKQNQYEHTVNVPMLIAGPDVPGGAVVTAQGALRDLFPTLCDLCELPIPPSVQGNSWLPNLREQRPTSARTEFGYFTDSQRMIRSEDGWKLIWYPHLDREQFFHLPSDPDELVNLSNRPAHQERKQSLRRELLTWLREHHDPVASGEE